MVASRAAPCPRARPSESPASTCTCTHHFGRHAPVSARLLSACWFLTSHLPLLDARGACAASSRYVHPPPFHHRKGLNPPRAADSSVRAGVSARRVCGAPRVSCVCRLSSWRAIELVSSPGLLRPSKGLYVRRRTLSLFEAYQNLSVNIDPVSLDSAGGGYRAITNGSFVNLCPPPRFWRWRRPTC